MNHNQKYNLKKLKNIDISSFEYEEYGIKGVGKNRYPIISMDQYIDHDLDDELHIECCKGLALSTEYKTAMLRGAILPEEISKFTGRDTWCQLLSNLESIDPNGTHKLALEEIIDIAEPNHKMQAVYRYAYYALGAPIPWFFALYLKNNDFNTKNNTEGQWTDSAKYFPKLIKYLDTLPFKNIGRVMFFTTYPNAGVITHRDSVVAEHKDHNINLFFSAGWRPSYIWDEKKKEKIYLQKNSASYFFNNRDYHGVDPEPVFRYTLRVDGTFTDELCDNLGLIDGHTWKWSYE